MRNSFEILLNLQVQPQSEICAAAVFVAFLCRNLTQRFRDFPCLLVAVSEHAGKNSFFQSLFAMLLEGSSLSHHSCGCRLPVQHIHAALESTWSGWSCGGAAWIQAERKHVNLIFEFEKVQELAAELPVASGAVGRAGYSISLREEWDALGALPRARVHAGRRACLLPPGPSCG